MPGPLKRPEPFIRRGRHLPGQSSDEDLDVNITFKVIEGTTAAVINEELIQIGNLGAGRYVQIDATGLKLFIDSTGTVQIQFHDGQDFIGSLYSLVDSNTSQMFLSSQGKGAADPEASVGMQALTYDGTPHAGTGSVTITAETKNDRITLAAEETKITESLILTPMTTTARNLLTATNGMIIYNNTTNKFQGYVSGAWTDLH